MKNISIIISLSIILSLNIGTNCFSQKSQKVDTVKIDGRPFIVDYHKLTSRTEKNTLKEKNIIYDTVEATSIKDANNIRKKYEAEGWTYYGMLKDKDGHFIVFFFKEIETKK